MERATLLNPTIWHYNPERHLLQLLSPDVVQLLLKRHNTNPNRSRSLLGVQRALFKNGITATVGGEPVENLTESFADFFRNVYVSHAQRIVEFFFSVGFAPTKLNTQSGYPFPVPTIIPFQAGLAFMVFDKYTGEHRFLWQWYDSVETKPVKKETKDKATFKTSSKDRLRGFVTQGIPYDPNVIFYVGCEPAWIKDNIMEYMLNPKSVRGTVPSTRFTSPLANCLVEVIRRDNLSELVIAVEKKRATAPIYVETHLGTNPKDMIDIYNDQETIEETRIRHEHERTLGNSKSSYREARKNTSLIDAYDPPQEGDETASARDKLMQQYQYLGPAGKAIVNMNRDSIGLFNNPIVTKDGNTYVLGPAHRMAFQPLPTSVQNFEYVDTEYKEMMDRAYLLSSDNGGKNQKTKKTFDLQEEQENGNALFVIAKSIADHLSELLEWSVHHNKRNMALAKLFETSNLEEAMSYYDSLEIKVVITVQPSINIPVLLDIGERIPREDVKQKVYDVASSEVLHRVGSNNDDTQRTTSQRTSGNRKGGSVIPSNNGKKRAIGETDNTETAPVEGVKKKRKGEEDEEESSSIEENEVSTPEKQVDNEQSPQRKKQHIREGSQLRRDEEPEDNIVPEEDDVVSEEDVVSDVKKKQSATKPRTGK